MRKWILVGVIALLAAALVGIAFFGLFAIRAPRQFRIAAGPKEGSYYARAEALSKALAAKGYRLQVLETEGSLDNVALLQSGRADIGLLQGGTASFTDTTGLQTLALVGYEPVWIFYNNARGARTITRLSDLRGLRVGIGAPGSGTRNMALMILALAGLDADNTILVEDGMAETADMLRDGKLDAAFFVTATRTPLISELANDPGLSLYRTQRAQAIERLIPFMRAVTLPEGAFSLAKNIPNEDVPMPATRTALVSRQGFHPDLVRLVLTALPSILPVPLVGERDAFPSITDVEIAANPDAFQYFREGPTPLERVLPFEIASPLSRIYLVLLPLLVFAFPIWSLIKAVYNWYMKSRIVNWYPQILAIERQLPRYTLPQVDEKLAFLRDIDDKISQKIRVSAGYMQSYYQMRGDVRFVIGRLEQRRDELLNGQAAVEPDTGTVDDARLEASHD